MATLQRLGVLAASALALVLPAPAALAQPAPFGHACSAEDGVRFCPTTDLAGRVKSWDGVPLDVDVTLPPSGDGPFPTILLLHGLTQTKTAFEGTGRDPLYNIVAFARRGYAVVTPTARGFGNSCGKSLQGTPGCERAWARLDDIRYEIRDIQWLAGLLVDEGIANPKRIGATGISYGGGASTMLAFLRDRVVLPNGRLAPWRSPAGKRISLAAAWPRWLWTNGEAIFTRNGRGAWSREPPGVPVKAWADTIFLGANLGLIAPLGSELSADVNGWKQLLDQGRFDARARAVLRNAFLYHGVASLKGRSFSRPDGRMPCSLSHRRWPAIGRSASATPTRRLDADRRPGSRRRQPPARHRAPRQAGQQVPGRLAAPERQTAQARQGHRAHADLPARRTCRRRAVHRARFRLTGPRREGLRHKEEASDHLRGASPALAAALNPVSGDFCVPQRQDPTSRATFSARSRGVTLLGLPVLTGRVETKGRYGQLDARVWDLDPMTDMQRLVTRGTYRLTDNQRGRFRFVLDGNGWRFARGHRIVVELLGRDAPTYLPSTTNFSASLSDLRIRLPIRE